MEGDQAVANVKRIVRCGPTARPSRTADDTRERASLPGLHATAGKLDTASRGCCRNYVADSANTPLILEGGFGGAFNLGINDLFTKLIDFITQAWKF